LALAAMLAVLLLGGTESAPPVTPTESGPPATSATSEDGRITIEIPIFEGGEGKDFFIQCAREYEKVHPDIAVNLDGDPRIADKVRVRILEGTFFEATNAGINFWPLIRHGDILALDDFLDGPNWEGDNTWRDSFLPGVLDRFAYEGKVYGVPFFYSVFVMWYNKTIFEEHGWTTPHTWDEFFALCDEIKAADIPPIAFQGRYPGYSQALIDAGYYHLAGAKRWFDQTNLEPGSFDNPEFVEALGLVQKTAEYFQDGCMGMSHTEAQQQFFNGRTAMIPCGTWLKSETLGNIPEGFRLGCFNLPVAEPTKADPNALYVGSNYYFVMAHSKHPAEAVDFFRFMTSREQAGTFAEMRDMPTAIRGANEGRLSSDMDELLVLISRAESVYGQVPGEGYPEMTQQWDDWRPKLLTGKATPAQCAKGLEEGAQAVRYRAENPDEVNVRYLLQPTILIAVLVLAAGYWVLSTVHRARRPSERAVGAEAESNLRMRFRNVVLFVGPAALLYTVFVIVPCAKSFGWSLNEWDGLTDMRFVGLLYFKRLLFDSDIFWKALIHNLFIMLVIPAFVLPLSLFLAACISRGLPGSTLFRIVFFFPNILGSVAAILLWVQLYNPGGGPVNASLAGVGEFMQRFGENHPLLAQLPGATWLAGTLAAFKSFAWLSQDYLYWALVPMSIWGGCGFNMILFLAAMESVPVSLYEAAELDGASQWRQFWTITFPLIWDVLAIAIVLMVIGGMKAFESIWLFTNQAPASDTHVIGTMMVSSMFTEFKVGQATAIAVLLFLLVFIGTAATLRLMRRERVEY